MILMYVTNWLVIKPLYKIAGYLLSHMAALDDPNASDETRKQKVKQWIDAADDVVGLGSGAEVH